VNALSAAMPSVAHVKRRLDTELAGARRFAHFHSQLQKLFDLPAPAIDALLARSEQADAWEGGLAEGVSLLTVEAGPGCEGCMTALVRLEPGAQFPDHEHGGRERVLVLEGGYRDSTGVEVWRGELDVREAGTSHSFTALPDGPCICASVLKAPEA